MKQYFSTLMSAYRTNYNPQHVLIRLLEEWRKKLDKCQIVGVVLTELSKDFDCIAHDLLIAKSVAHGLSEEALIYILSDISNCKQCVRINDSGCPSGFYTGLSLF